MARILVVDDDPDIALLVEASLEGAGHQVVTTTSPDQVVGLASSEEIDAVVLDVLMPGVSGYEVLRRLREDARTARIPVLLLSAANDSRHRVQGLREGASDFVAKPFDPDELVLRVERLAAGASSRDLEGHLESFPFWELLQSLQLGRRSGRLELLDSPREAFLQLHLGGVRNATFGNLAGREAALTMAHEADGRFRFQAAGPDDVDTAAGVEISINGLLMESAFLKDELRARQRFVPSPRLILSALPAVLPPLPETFESIPVAATFLRILEKGDTSLHKLEQVLAVAPQKIRLSVAWLLEQGFVTTAGAPMKSPEEESPGAGSEMATTFRRLFLAARLSNRASDQVHVLLLAHGDSWHQLEELVARAAASSGDEAWAKLRRQMELRRGGTAHLRIEDGRLSVHVQLLSASSKARAMATLTLCTAVALWLDDSASLELAQDLIDRLETAERSQTGLLLVPDAAIAKQARESLRGSERWRLSSGLPTTLPRLLALL